MDDHHHHGSKDNMIHRWTFRDFITPDPQSTVHVAGHEATLDALNLALTGGACVHHHAHGDSVYAPILHAINRVCKTLSIFGYLPVTLNDLIEVQRQPWFQTLLEQYAKRYHLSNVMLSAEDNELTGDRVVVLFEPRKTAARVIAQQVPLPANLTAADILLHHKDHLQYVDSLKVALVYSNQKISEECQAQGKLKQPSAVVKRIKRVNTALAWIEREFDISKDAFRTAFDREPKSNGIPIRGKDTAVDNTVLEANANKIDAAMTWIKTGGSRPTPVTTAANPTGANPLINYTLTSHTTGPTAPDADGFDLDSILKMIRDPYSN
jgi:hypothetical protein